MSSLRRRWERLPAAVIAASVTLAAVPLVIWWAGPPTADYPAVIATAVAALLAAEIFMLSAAQTLQDRALDVTVRDLTAADERLCDAAMHGDPEPWQAQFEREIRTLQTIAAISSASPADRRELVVLRSRASQLDWNRATARLGLFIKLRDRAEPDTDKIVERGLTDGRAAVPAEYAEECDWDRLARLDEKRRKALDATNERLEVLVPRMSRVKEPAFPVWGKSLARSPRLDGLLNALAVPIRALDTATVLVAGLASLTTAGLVYGAGTLGWPPPPSLLAAATALVLAIVYLVHVRGVMQRAGMAAGNRIQALPSLRLKGADMRLTDTSVGRTADEGTDEDYFDAFVGGNEKDSPLRHRLLGQFQLARTCRLLTHLHGEQLAIAHFERVGERDDLTNAAVLRELSVAEKHLRLAVDHRNDDPIAWLALAGTLDAIAAARCRPPDTEIDELIDWVMVAAAPRSRRPEDVAAVYRLNQFRWMWPRDDARLSDFVSRVVPSSPGEADAAPSLDKEPRAGVPDPAPLSA